MSTYFSGTMYYATTNSTTSNSYYRFNNYYGSNTTWTYTPKKIKDFKNQEMKHVLDKERGW
jgi:hypothetical protein